jgi:hypothetical protein
VGGEEDMMADSVYKVIELIGTSTESWEKAAVAQASKTLRDLRIAEVVEMDLQIDGGRVRGYRTKVRVSFKYEKEDMAALPSVAEPGNPGCLPP